MTALVLQFDGGARPNPGRTSSAAILYTPDGDTAYHACTGIELGSNNVAEMTALEIGLEHALRLGANAIEVYGDSDLVIAQIFRGAAVNAENLKPIAARIRSLLARFGSVRGRHITREQNAAADALGDRFLSGTYVPFDADGLPHAFTIGLRLPGHSYKAVAQRNSVKKALLAGLRSEFSSAQLVRTGTDPFQGPDWTEITFVADLRASRTSVLDLARAAFPHALRVTASRISG